jgi:hypothetical protein
MIEMGNFLTAICPTLCPEHTGFGQRLLEEAALFRDDFEASLYLSVVNDEHGKPFFIPPVAALNYTPFVTMTDTTVSEYSNFRYYSELLGADILPLALSTALQDFREQTGGTVSGITRWSDHLGELWPVLPLPIAPRLFITQETHRPLVSCRRHALELLSCHITTRGAPGPLPPSPVWPYGKLHG